MLLEACDLTAFYGDFQALFGIDLAIYEGETVALIGANGAGKSTFLRAVTGMLPTMGQEIRFDGKSVAGWPPSRIHKAGIAMVPEGRKLFSSLTVEENLLIGASGGRLGEWNLDKVYDLFPELVAKRGNLATALSGGQQQMVAIGRSLMSNPRLLLCDEISLGLAPKVIKNIYESLPRVKQSGATILVVEQDVSQALTVADRVHCFMEGRISLSGRPDELTRAQIAAAYFGLPESEEAA